MQHFGMSRSATISPRNFSRLLMLHFITSKGGTSQRLMSPQPRECSHPLILMLTKEILHLSSSNMSVLLLLLIRMFSMIFCRCNDCRGLDLCRDSALLDQE